MGLVLGLLFCAVILAGLGTHAARSSSEEMRTRHLPFMETALSLERLVYETVFHASMFGTSGDMASYSGTRILLPSVRNTADDLSTQALQIPEGHVFAREMEVLRDLAEQLDLVVEKKRTLNGELGAEKETLQKLADDMGEILLELQARVASAKVDKGAEINLDEKARLLVLNGFSLTVADVTGRVQGHAPAGVAGNADNVAKVEALFAMRWDEAREACAAAAALLPPEGPAVARGAGHPADDMARLVSSYKEVLDAIQFNLEESARIMQDRIAVTGRLTILTRSLVASVRASMVAAAKRTDTALWGATVTLFACALLACILGVGAAAAFARSGHQQPVRVDESDGPDSPES